MKRTIFYAVLLIQLCFTVSAQDDLMSEKKNELGLDFTGFIRYFTTFQGGDDFQYNPFYFLTYRRYFDSGNFRSGVGCDIRRFSDVSPFDDSTIYPRKTTAFNLRSGWEWKIEIGKRWQAFYGVDLRYVYSQTLNGANFYNGGYANGSETKNNTFSLSPLLGIRFRVSDRISLITEASLLFNYLISSRREFKAPVIDDPVLYPELDDVVQPTIKSFYTSFQQPVSVFFVFSI